MEEEEVYNPEAEEMFEGAIAFNGDISGFSTGKVKNFGKMFQNSIVFNSDISNYNTFSATTMSGRK